MSSKRMGLRRAFATLLCGLASAGVGADDVRLTRVYGYAYDARTQGLVYRELREQFSRHGELLVSSIAYLDASGAARARKYVDFSVDAYAPSYQLDDLQTGLAEGVRHRAGLLEAFHRPALGAAEETRRLPVEGTVVVDIGLERFIEANWEALLADESLPVKVLVPASLDALDFMVSRIGEGALGGVPAVTFRAEPANLMLRTLMTPVRITCARETREILMYEGAPAVRDVVTPGAAVLVVYPPEERRSLEVERAPEPSGATLRPDASRPSPAVPDATRPTATAPRRDTAPKRGTVANEPGPLSRPCRTGAVAATDA